MANNGWWVALRAPIRNGCSEFSGLKNERSGNPITLQNTCTTKIDAK